MIEHTFFLPIFTAGIHEKYFNLLLYTYVFQSVGQEVMITVSIVLRWKFVKPVTRGRPNVQPRTVITVSGLINMGMSEERVMLKLRP